jgi:hypothetical protein
MQSFGSLKRIRFSGLILILSIQISRAFPAQVSAKVIHEVKLLPGFPHLICNCEETAFLDEVTGSLLTVRLKLFMENGVFSSSHGPIFSRIVQKSKSENLLHTALKTLVEFSYGFASDQVATALVALEERVIALHDQLANVRTQESQALKERDGELRRQLEATREELGRKIDGLRERLRAPFTIKCGECGHLQEVQPPHQGPGQSQARPPPQAQAIPPAVSQPVRQENDVQENGEEGARVVDYRWSKPKNVFEIVKQFEEDDPAGRRSFNWLESNGSRTWKADLKIDRKRFDEIKVIYDGVKALAQHRQRSIRTAAILLEELRAREHLSIKQVEKLVRSKRVAAKDRYKEATVDVQEFRIPKDFGAMLSAECSP